MRKISLFCWYFEKKAFSCFIICTISQGRLSKNNFTLSSEKFINLLKMNRKKRCPEGHRFGF